MKDQSLWHVILGIFFARMFINEIVIWTMVTVVMLGITLVWISFIGKKIEKN